MSHRYTIASLPLLLLLPSQSNPQTQINHTAMTPAQSAPSAHTLLEARPAAAPLPSMAGARTDRQWDRASDLEVWSENDETIIGKLEACAEVQPMSSSDLDRSLFGIRLHHRLPPEDVDLPTTSLLPLCNLAQEGVCPRWTYTPPPQVCFHVQDQSRSSSNTITSSHGELKHLEPRSWRSRLRVACP